MSFETISVIGLGYIGLPTAAMFASHKIKVIGVDINQHAIDTINKGKIHIVEPGLEELVQTAVSNNYLKAVKVPEPADAYLIAVPTPFLPCDINEIPTADLKYIESACQAIAPILKKGDLVILESTSPVGTTEQLAEWLALARPDLTFPQDTDDTADVNIAHCPERVLPGHVVCELVQNDRVIGGISSKCSKRAISLYKIFVQGNCIVTNARTAEMAKLTENSFRDVNIAFANELSIICDTLDINVWELISLANRHPRVNILQPGPGVGGHCIAVDPWFIVSKSPTHSRLIHTARIVNDEKPEWVIQKVKLAITDLLQANPNKTVKDIIIACYGLAFKPNIDDLRESPSMKIAETILSGHRGTVLLVEPNISLLSSPKLKEGILVEQQCAYKKADIHVLLVDHKDFKKGKPEEGIIIDTKGIWI